MASFVGTRLAKSIAMFITKWEFVGATFGGAIGSTTLPSTTGKTTRVSAFASVWQLRCASCSTFAHEIRTSTVQHMSVFGSERRKSCGSVRRTTLSICTRRSSGKKRARHSQLQVQERGGGRTVGRVDGAFDVQDGARKRGANRESKRARDVRRVSARGRRSRNNGRDRRRKTMVTYVRGSESNCEQDSRKM